MKRWYEKVEVEPRDHGYGVALDGRPLRTPLRRDLVVPIGNLADAAAEEWRAQGETIRPDVMPVTRLATTVLDLMPARRGAAIDEAHGFAGTDMLCYRAADPETLVRRQEAAWQPWLDWAARQLDARLVVTAGIEPIAQPADALGTLRRHVERLDDWRLAGLHALTTASGSLVLGFAVEQGALDAAAVFELALLDELFEIERWGLDELQARRHAALRCDLDGAGRFLRALTG